MKSTGLRQPYVLIAEKGISVAQQDCGRTHKALSGQRLAPPKAAVMEGLNSVRDLSVLRIVVIAVCRRAAEPSAVPSVSSRLTEAPVCWRIAFWVVDDGATLRAYVELARIMNDRS